MFHNSFSDENYNAVERLQLVREVNTDHMDDGLRTRNEGINQRYLKNWAQVANKISFGRT